MFNLKLFDKKLLYIATIIRQDKVIVTNPCIVIIVGEKLDIVSSPVDG